jgi:multidrug efflux pump subunit AcrB
VIARHSPAGRSLAGAHAPRRREGEQIISETPGTSHWSTIGGFLVSRRTNSSNASTVLISLKPWDERTELR